MAAESRSTAPAPLTLDGGAVVLTKPYTVNRDKVASALWDALASPLLSDNVLAPVDGVTLTCLCSAYSRLVKARRVLQKEKWTVEGATGGVKAHPMLGVEQAACGELARYADQLGLSPTARARITRLEAESRERSIDDEMDE